MAATLAPSAFGLQPPPSDDTMEISSDFGNIDGDIDIDFDEPQDAVNYADDEQMIDDVKSQHDDDVMQDDPVTATDHHHPVEDRVMQDDASSALHEHDEELLDFSDDEDNFPPPVNVSVSAPAATTTPTLHSVSNTTDPVEQVQSDLATELLADGAAIVHQPDQLQQPDHLAEQTDIAQDTEQWAPAHEETAPIDAQVASLDSQENGAHGGEAYVAPENNHPGPAVATEHVAESRTEDTHQGLVSAIVESTEVAVEALDDDAEQQHADPDAPHLTAAHSPAVAADNAPAANDAALEPALESKPSALTVDTEVSKYDEVDDDDDDHAAAARQRHSQSPTITGLHPTIVEYETNEIYLFPSRDSSISSTYLLQDENLVTTSLGDLLQACRTVLADNISENEELVLGVKELGLYVSEDSTPAFSTSFFDLLEVYLQLHKLDGNEQPPPFHVTLKKKTKFTNRLNLITAAIAEGKGFSQLPFLDIYGNFTFPPFPDEDDFDDDSFQDVHEEHDQEYDHSSTLDDHAGEQGEVKSHQDAAHPTDGPNQEDNKPNKQSSNGEPDHSQEHVDSTASAEGLQDDTQYFDAEGDDLYTEDYDEFHQQDVAEVSLDANTAGIDAEEDIFNDDDDKSDNGTAEPLTGATGAGPQELQLEDDLSEQVNIATSDSANASYDATAPAVEDSSDAGHVDQVGTEQQADFDGTVAVEQNPATDDSSTEVVSHSVADHVTATSNEDSGEAVQESVQDTFETNGTAHDAEIDFDDDFDDDFTVEPYDEQSGSQELPAKAESDHGTAVTADDEQIDFDDDFESETAVVDSPTKLGSTQASPSIKRSFSERHDTEDVEEDEQTLKKVRS